MLENPNRFWYIGGGAFAAILACLSLGFDLYPQFPSMCIILGIVISILIDSMETIPAIKGHDWTAIWSDIRSEKLSLWRWFLFLHSKVVFPTLFTIYLLLLIVQKVKIFPWEWQSYASAAVDVLHLLWVTLASAVLANFSWLPDTTHEITKHSRWNNVFSLLLICTLSYGGMWSVFTEIASIGRVAFFVALSVGIILSIVGVMILTESEDK